jgi:subtilisin family serine protease
MSLYSELIDKQVEWKDDSTCIITFDRSEKDLFKDRILKQDDVKSCNPVYAINTGLEMGVTDEFVVKKNENVTEADIEKLHKKFEVKVVKTTEINQLLKVPVGSDALEIANKYQETGLIRFSYPNFICEMELHQVIPNDPYFINQFSLHNTGQVFTDGHFGTTDADIDAPEVWTITQGNNNIIIAVLDQGLTPNHPDLPNARQIRLNGSNFADGDPNNPSPTGNNNHGNACAGIIGATQNNNQGISGIAPNCRIMPIRIFNTNGTGITPQRVADAINFARQNGAHIISNSWGYNSDNPNLHPVIRDAIIIATTQGRNNLGCIVIFSAGNSANRVIGNNGFIAFPANVNVAGVLTIGASDRDDLQSNYSPTSNPASPNNQIIDLVAPSHRAYSCQIATETFEAWSIDIPGNDGYNPVHNNDCGALPGIGTILPNAGINNLSFTGRFGGTSYSCPQVAGVAALMLSINPNLTQQQVFNILTTTADRVGGYVYTNGRSNELGFGRLNSCRAVTQVISIVSTISGPNLVCTSGSTFSVSNIPTGCIVQWSSGPYLSLYSGQNSNSCTFKSTVGIMQFKEYLKMSLTLLLTILGLKYLNKEVLKGFFFQVIFCKSIFKPALNRLYLSNKMNINGSF